MTFLQCLNSSFRTGERRRRTIQPGAGQPGAGLRQAQPDLPRQPARPCLHSRAGLWSHSPPQAATLVPGLHNFCEKNLHRKVSEETLTTLENKNL